MREHSQNLSARRLFTVATVAVASLLATMTKADVVIGNFESGSVDGWTSPQESVASVAGKGNTLGGSSAGVTILGGFWGLQTVNLNPNRDAFLKAKFLSFDLTFIQPDLQGAGYAQTKEFALHDSSG